MTETNRGKPLSFRVRQEIQERVQSGESRRQVAEQLQIARNTANKYAKKS